MSTKRERLPNRRRAENISFNFKGHPMVANIGFYDNSERMGEIFIVSAGKSGTDINTAMHEAGVAVSFALQHGADIESMRKAFPRTEDGKAEGAVGQLLDLLAARPKVVS